MSDDLPVQLATRLPDRSAGGLLRYSAALPVSPHVSCRTPTSTSPTRTTCCGHPREDVTRMLRRNCFRGVSAIGLRHTLHEHTIALEA